MPYGCDFGPPGDGHSVALPVLGSNRPRYPRALSEYQSTSSLVIATRRGRVSGFGSVYSLITIVFGSMLDSLLTANCTNHGVPLESTTMPYGLVRSVGGETSVISLVF